MKKLLGDAQLEEARSCASAVQKIARCNQSIGRFWYQEIHDFLIPGYTVLQGRFDFDEGRLASALARRDQGRLS
jgi:hypothetical protein